MVEEAAGGAGETVAGAEVGSTGVVAVVSGGHTGGGSGGLANPVAVHAERRSDAAATACTTVPIPVRREEKRDAGEGSTGATS